MVAEWLSIRPVGGVILPRLKARASRAASAEADLHGASNLMPNHQPSHRRHSADAPEPLAPARCWRGRHFGLLKASPEGEGVPHPRRRP